MGTFLYSTMKIFSLVGLDMSVQMGDWVKKKHSVSTSSPSNLRIIRPVKIFTYTHESCHRAYTQPNEWLEKAKSLLTEDGILVINVPNKYSLAARFQNLLVDLKIRETGFESLGS